MIRQIKRHIGWLVLGLYWPLIFIGTHIPRVPPMQIVGKDKTLHVGAFLILTLFFWPARYGTARPSLRRRAAWVMLLILMIYAALDELTQEWFVPGRHGDVMDWVADTTGMLIGLTLLYFLRTWRNWLIVYWLGLLAVTHFPGGGFLRALPLGLDQFRALGVMLAYLVLTLLWWRSLCRAGHFEVNKPIVFSSLCILPAYALADQSLALVLNHRFDIAELCVALAGIGLGIMVSVAWAWHHEEAQVRRQEKDYT